MDSFAVELRFHASEEFSFLLRNTESFERTFDVVGHFVPAAFRLGPWREIVTDFVEVDCFEILARPMRGKRLFQKRLQAAQAKLAHPIGILFHISDVMDGSLAQSGACVAHVSFWVK